MAKSPKKKEEDYAPVPFKDALKQVWGSPPQPKTSKKKAKKAK